MRTARPVLTAALLLALTTGCTASADVPSSTPTSSPDATSDSASPSPSPTDPKALARSQAEDLVREYYTAIDQVGANPDKPLSQLKHVATSIELDALRQSHKQWRKDGWRETGRTQIADLVVQSVSLDNSDPEVGKVPTVQVDVCYDVSDVDVVDSSGTSVIDPNRANRGWDRLQVANYDYRDDPADGWRVAARETLEKAPCGGS